MAIFGKGLDKNADVPASIKRPYHNLPETPAKKVPLSDPEDAKKTEDAKTDKEIPIKP